MQFPIPLRNAETGEERNFHDKQAVSDFFGSGADHNVWTGWENLGELPLPTPPADPVELDQTQKQAPAEPTAQTPAFTTAQIAALTTAEIVAWSTAQIAALTTEHVAALTTDQVGALTNDQVDALSEDQIRAIQAGTNA